MATIPLESPLTRGEQTITTLTLRKPAAGELRGIVLSDLIRMEAGAVSAVLPRIADPALTPADVAKMDAADFMSCALEIADFLVPQSKRPAPDSTATQPSPGA